VRVLVTGSRDFDRPDVVAGCLDILVRQAVEACEEDFVVVHGACPSGADAHADAWVLRRDHPWELQVHAERHPAIWSTGKAAGFQRNADMARLGADICLAFWRAESAGTGHMIRLAEEAEIPVKVIRYEDLEVADAHA
jgi:hypothetical protein